MRRSNTRRSEAGARPLIFGTLDGTLAKRQTQTVINRLAELLPRSTCQMTIIPSPVNGSESSDEPYLACTAAEVEHLEDRLLADEFRLVVVRAADLVLPLRDGVLTVAVPQRIRPFDALLNRDGLITEEMPAGKVVGVLNLAVKAQMQPLWPHLHYRILTGGVDRALERFLRHKEVDALVMPASAAEDLGIQGIVSEIFYPELILPSGGQGILVVLARADDREAAERLAPLHSESTAREMAAEHAVIQRLASDQDLPVGVLAHLDVDRLEVAAAVGSPRGDRVRRAALTGSPESAEDLGTRLAEKFLRHAESLIDLLEADFPDGLPGDEAAGEDLAADDLDLDDPGADRELDEAIEAELADLDRRPSDD
ncbi:MAG: hypothetical protein R6X25_12625 [Candidatus Krumholzibacteriia bacterium]